VRIRRLLPLVPCLLIAAAGVSQALQFELKHGYVVVVPCTLAPAGQFHCVVDTGTDQSVLDTGVAKRLKLVTQRASASTLNRDQQVRSATLPELRLGPLHAEQLTVFVADLSQSSERFGTRVDVIVGLDVLREKALIIDYQHHQLSFGTNCSAGDSAPMLAGQGFVVVQAAVEDQPTRLKLDTGWEGLLLFRDRMKAPLPAADTSDQLQTAFGGSLAGGSVRLREFALGLQRVPRLTATVLEHGPAGFDAYDGVLGPRALQASQLCLDFERRVVRWEH